MLGKLKTMQIGKNLLANFESYFKDEAVEM